MRNHLRRRYQERTADIAFDTYVYIDNTNSQVGIDIAVSGGEIFDLPEHVLQNTSTTPVLSNSTFLWMFIIRKYLQDSDAQTPALNVPIVIDLDDKGSETIESVRQIEGIMQPMSLADLAENLVAKDVSTGGLSWESKQLRDSLRLFGVTFSIEDVVAPLLAFDVYSSELAIVNSNILKAKYANGRKDLADCLMTYVFAITAISFSEIDAINSECMMHNLALVNSTLDRAIDTNDSEHRDDVLKLDNKYSRQLLAKLGGSRAVDKKHSKFTDIIKLYSLLEEVDKEVCISYNDFADHTYVDSNTYEVGMTEGQLRALALFHLQHPDNPIDFDSMPLKQQHYYCMYVADLADRKEGTLSDRLLALHSKAIGSLYTIGTSSYKRHFARLDAIKLSSSNAITNDSIQILSLPITKLFSCLHFVDNRPTVTRVEQSIFFNPLPYGENPFDYRPDFVIDPLAAAPKYHKLTCIGSNFFCDYSSENPNQMAISILPVLSTLLHTDLLNPIMQAELIDYADYSSVRNYDTVDDTADLTVCKGIILNSFAENNDEATPTVGRSIQEKSFIANAFIHRLLRYFESVLQEQVEGAGIQRRILSLADLLCYEDNGTVYVGIADTFESMFEVTPLIPTITIGSERRYTGATDGDFSSLDDCVMALPKRIVSSITPTTIFNQKEELPTAVRAIVHWLNKHNDSGEVLEYKDYVSYGMQFDSWDAYLVLQSCSAAGALDANTQSFFGNTNKDYATVTSGCAEDIHAAYLEYKRGIISYSEYIARTQKMCELYITSILTIPLYSLEYTRERSILCNAQEIVKRIDFRFFKNVRLQYSPISIFGTWNAHQNTITWHTSLLN